MNTELGKKITKEDRDWGLAQYEILSRLIEEGKWSYSLSALTKERHAYSQITWQKLHPNLTTCCFIFGVIFFFPLLIIYPIILVLLSKSFEKYETHLTRLKHNRSFTNDNELFKNISSAEKISSATEISNLHDLLTKGAISEEEYQNLKSSLIKKNVA